MPGPVNRDSISKCAQGNDLYAMIRNPTMKITSQPVKQVDTIKSLRGQMERDALAKLGKATQNFIFVARAGKFVFLAIAMPPYILFYGLPKWVMVDVLPSLFQHGFKPFHILGEKLKKAFQSSNEKGMMGHVRHVLSSIKTKAAEYVNWVNNASKALFVHLKHQTVALGYRLLQPYLLPAIQRSVKAAEAAAEMILQQTYKTSEKHAALARQILSFAWQSTKHEVIQQLQPIVSLVKNQFAKLRKQVRKIIEKPRLEIQRFKTAFTRSFKKIKEVLENSGAKITKSFVQAAAAVNYIARPIVEWISPKIQWSASVFHSANEKIRERFEQVRGFIQNVTSGLRDALKISHQAAMASLKNTVEIVIAPFLKQFFNPQGGFKKQSQELWKRIGKKIKKQKNNLQSFIIDTQKAVRHQLSVFLMNVKAFFKYLKWQIGQMPRRFLNLTLRIYRSSIQAAIKTGHFLRWLSIWSRVLARLAWEELRETTTSFIKILTRRS